jgi:hypothetical protein
MRQLQQRIEAALTHRCNEMLDVGFIIFNKKLNDSEQLGEIICQSTNVQKLLEVFH